MAYKELSKFMSDDGKREAIVYKMLGLNESGFNVSVKNDSGTTFSTCFELLDEAENFAEDWVML